MNLQAKLYYPILIVFSLISLLGLSYVTLNITSGMGLLMTLIAFCLYGISIGQLSFDYIKSLGEVLKYGVGVVSIMLPIALFIKAAEAVVGIGAFELASILNFELSAFFVLLPTALCFYAIFAFNIFVYRSFIADMDSRYRLAFAVGSISLVYTVFYFIVGFHISPVVFAAAIASYLTLLDLFVERYSPSIVWTVLWNVMLCAFLSLILFSANNMLLIASGESVAPIVDAFSFYSICFVFSSGILFLFSRLAELDVFDESIFSLFKRRRLLQDKIQYTLIGILVISFVMTASISILYFNNLSGDGTAGYRNYDFIHALLNAYVFLFLIGFGIVVSIASYITRPIGNLGYKLKQIKLSRKNEPIEWQSNDEIGGLINEYNSMISKLESNAKVLAQTERDTAWREMARQVAHEIKNPLTPMKLSLQHMQRIVHRDGGASAEEVVDKMCKTLMEQIDNLSQISNEFSNFAQLPSANNHKILLNEVVETVHDLFRKRDDMDVRMIEPIDDVLVHADKNNLIRILNNLIKNAIQAIPSDRRGEVIIRLYKDSTKGIIEVKDNGIGIAEEMKKKIFTPNFTTKSSGTGLGLAIASNMVDSFGGNIYFESDEQQGTTFFLEIPLNRSIDN